ncbi:MAG: hypothetical protein JOS17DRAFT_376805 [Linnemannia elongata]|nr:MAG: hypothetical protein JOS17DRAFT_376805 [Linnemannia elongata]
MSLEGFRDHLRPIRQPAFNPARDYTAKGFVPRGSIRTDGYRLQVPAYKLHELSCVRYKRLPLDQLPLRLTSTLSGLDDPLTEIRNVVTTKEDVARLWGCPPSDIKILAVDLGREFWLAQALFCLPRNPPRPSYRQQHPPHSLPAPSRLQPLKTPPQRHPSPQPTLSLCQNQHQLALRTRHKHFSICPSNRKQFINQLSNTGNG